MKYIVTCFDMITLLISTGLSQKIGSVFIFHILRVMSLPSVISSYMTRLLRPVSLNDVDILSSCTIDCPVAIDMYAIQGNVENARRHATLATSCTKEWRFF